MKKTVLLICLLAAWSGLAEADEAALGDLLIQQPWARASIGRAKAGAAYLTIVNRGETADRLRAAETPVADRARLHSNLLEEGVMKMRPVEALEIAPGEPAVLRPGGLHIMLMGLAAPLEEGARFPLTLVFERAGRVTVEVEVAAPTAIEAPPGDPSSQVPEG